MIVYSHLLHRNYCLVSEMYIQRNPAQYQNCICGTNTKFTDRGEMQFPLLYLYAIMPLSVVKPFINVIEICQIVKYVCFFFVVVVCFFLYYSLGSIFICFCMCVSSPFLEVEVVTFNGLWIIHAPLLYT